MTIQELYDWARTNGIEDFEITIHGDAGGDFELEVTDIDVLETRNEIYI